MPSKGLISKPLVAMLTREQFCHLTNLDNNTLKNRVKRGALPYLSPKKSRGSYTVDDAYLVIVHDHFAELRGTLYGAADDVCDLKPMLLQQRAALDWTSNPPEEYDAANDILVARICFDISAKNPIRRFCGIREHLNAALKMETAGVVSMIVGNATKAAAVLRSRASRNPDIDIRDFWLGSKNGTS